MRITGYTKEQARRILRFQPCDVPGLTGPAYAKASPHDVTVMPYMGSDTIEPFIALGRQVTVIGCSPLLHYPDRECYKIWDAIFAWPFADKIYHVIDCEELQELIHAAASPEPSTS